MGVIMQYFFTVSAALISCCCCMRIANYTRWFFMRKRHCAAKVELLFSALFHWSILITVFRGSLLLIILHVENPKLKRELKLKRKLEKLKKAGAEIRPSCKTKKKNWQFNIKTGWNWLQLFLWMNLLFFLTEHKLTESAVLIVKWQHLFHQLFLLLLKAFFLTGSC